MTYYKEGTLIQFIHNVGPTPQPIFHTAKFIDRGDNNDSKQNLISLRKLAVVKANEVIMYLGIRIVYETYDAINYDRWQRVHVFLSPSGKELLVLPAKDKWFENYFINDIHKKWKIIGQP